MGFESKSPDNGLLISQKFHRHPADGSHPSSEPTGLPGKPDATSRNCAIRPRSISAPTTVRLIPEAVVDPTVDLAIPLGISLALREDLSTTVLTGVLPEYARNLP